MADTQLASPNNSAYKTIFIAGPCSYVAEIENTRYFGIPGEPLLNGASNSKACVFAFAKADAEVAGKTQKLRLRAIAITNGTGPGVTLTAGLYPVTATSAEVYTVGAVTSGSTVAFASPSANTITSSNSGDFTIPSDGQYILGIATSGKSAGSSSTKFNLQLQSRNV